VYCDTFKNIDEHNFGTFQEHRVELFQTHCAKKRDIQIILTGHSHRRGLYLIDDLDESGRNSVTTRFFDFNQFDQVKRTYPGKLAPAIIVSDSGATIPRYNDAGEFGGWGSDQPAGTFVEFDQNDGSIRDLCAVRAATCHPRAVVALDYLDIYKYSNTIMPDDYVITQFESKEFEIKKEVRRQLDKIVFQIALNDEVSGYGIYIDRVHFYWKVDPGGAWRRVKLHIQDDNTFAIAGRSDVAAFCRGAAKNKERGNFMAIHLSNIGGFPRYNFDDWWCSEFQVDTKSWGFEGFFDWSDTHKKFIIQRDKTRGEVPSFDWRKKFVSSKYQ
jgi:hypothetical protein